ncbi:MAG: GyrI-like domain-containing protein [Bdellovibrionales bacterium]|nr:GyrI-like domain-containing protein [Bdellovibrionales bacterium]
MPSSEHLQYVATAAAFIEKNLTQPLQVSEVCQQIPLSAWQFQRLFRACVGDSIGSYMRKRRLTESAKALQMNSKLRMIDVALEYQFGSQEAYTRAFQKYFAMTPARFRKASLDLHIYGTPYLDSKKIQHFSKQITHQPLILKLEEMRIIGLTTTIRSPLGEEADFIDKLPPLWSEILEKRALIPHRKKGRVFGIAVGEQGSLNEETMTYFAGFEVPLGTEPPSEFSKLDLKSQTYATFENQGLPDVSSVTMDYIYGIWLPQSDYKRGSGYDFEIFDSRYNPSDDKSISTYYLPIIKNK